MPQYTNSALAQELKKPERLPVGWPWRLLLFVTIIFAVLFATYLGMTLGYKPYLNSQIKDFNAKINSLSQSVDEQEQQNLSNLYSQLINAQELLGSHTAVSKIFDFLEANTHKQIYYLTSNISLTEKSINLEGAASDYNILSQQLELFKRAPEIEKVFLDNSRLTEEGNIRFTVRLIFKQELVKS